MPFDLAWQNEYYEIAELINKTAEMKNCDFSCPQSETSRAHIISRSSCSFCLLAITKQDNVLTL